MAKLILKNKDDAVLEFPLKKPITKIGRRIGNDIQIDDKKVSSNHAHIIKKDGSYIIVDLGSTNGTFVNNDRVLEAKLFHEDQIKIGSYILVFQDVKHLKDADRASASRFRGGGRAELSEGGLADTEPQVDLSVAKKPSERRTRIRRDIDRLLRKTNDVIKGVCMVVENPEAQTDHTEVFADLAGMIEKAGRRKEDQRLAESIYAGLQKIAAAVTERKASLMDGFNPKEIIIKTLDGNTVRGKVNMGSEERVSDLFTKVENPFLIVFDATYKGGMGKVIFLNKRHIVWAEPAD